MVSAFLFFVLLWQMVTKHSTIENLLVVYKYVDFLAKKKIFFFWLEKREIFLKLFWFAFTEKIQIFLYIHNSGVFLKIFFCHTQIIIYLFVYKGFCHLWLAYILYEHKTFFYWLLIAVCVFCVASKMILRDFNARCLANDPWIKRVPHPLLRKTKGFFLSCIIR